MSRVRSIIDSYRIGSNAGTIDFAYTRLCNDPFLQSIYAETLRLHVAMFIMRGPYAGYELQGWHIPKDAVMLMSSYNAQTDSRRWSVGYEQTIPSVNEFWAERFLVPQASSVGETIPFAKSEGRVPKTSTASPTESIRPEFSLKGRSTDWFPYGGGQRMCPGRHFAKQEMLSTLAIMLTLFDIELAGITGIIPENDMEGFGFGALWPKEKTPFRIRRRVV